MKVEIEYQLSRNIQLLGHLEIAGGGQIVVQGDYAYIGHMRPPMGTSIINVSDPSNPVVVTHLPPPDPYSHCHKVRVLGDLMITNVEKDNRHFLRKGDSLAALRHELRDELGHDAPAAVLADRLGVTEADITLFDEAIARGYNEGGFRVWDISDKTAPKLLSYVKTHGFGVHRFDMDEKYAYISTEMEGYIGNILVTYDISDPTNPTEVSRWHEPGQHLAGGETPTWEGKSTRLHHAMRCGDELWAAYMHAGFRVLDASDITKPTLKGSYTFPKGIPEPTHTVMPFENPINGRRYALAIDEEHDHKPGRLHGFVWVMDITDMDNMEPVTAWDLSERASPWVGQPGARFGGHQFHEKLGSTLAYFVWFSGGLRVVDFSDPLLPVEVGHFMGPGPNGEAPQSNDVTVDDTGRIYILDRVNGMHIVEMTNDNT
jgi:hypothetical protein